MHRSAVVFLVGALAAATTALWLWPRDTSMAAPSTASDVATPTPTAATGAPRPVDTARESLATPTATLPDAAPDQIVGVVVDDAGEPVRGAQVTLQRPGHAGGPVPDPVPTDAAGRFVCAPVVPGPWHVLRAEAAGFVPDEQRAAAGRRVRVQLRRGAVLHGIVTDADLRPVPDARVLVLGPPQAVSPNPLAPLGPPAILARTHTDGRGAYQIGPVAPGQTRVWIVATAAVPEVRDVNLTEARAHQLDVKLQRTLALRCVARDAVNSEPIPGAELLGAAAEPLARSGRDGNLVLHVPAEVPQSLRLRAAGFAPAEVFLKAVPKDTERTTELLLLRGASVRGRVQDGAGQAVAGARVWAEPVPLPPGRTADRARAAARVLPRLPTWTTPAGPTPESFATTDADGGYVLDGLLGKSGVLRLRVRAACEGFGDAWSEPIDLDPPATTATADLRLARGGTIAGTVTLAGAPVVCEVRALVGTQAVVAAADDAGRFVLAHVPVGVAQVHASHPQGHQVAPREVTVTEASLSRVPIELTQVVPPSLILAGTVRGPDGKPLDGMVVRCEPTTPQPGSRGREAITNAQGQWQVQLPPSGADSVDTFTVTAGMGESESRLGPVRPPRTELDFTLPATVPVLVEATCEDRRDAWGVQVDWRRPGSTVWRHVNYRQLPALEGGPNQAPPTRCELRLLPGTYDLRFQAYRYLPVVLAAVRVDGSDTPLRVRFKHGPTVSLELTGDIEALEGRSLFLLQAGVDADPEAIARQRGWDAGGVCTLSRFRGALRAVAVPPGRYRVVSSDGDLAFDPEWIEVADQDVSGRVRITLRR